MNEPKTLLDALDEDFASDGPVETVPQPEAVQPDIEIKIPGVGGREEIFRGKNYEEVAQKIAESKKYANQFIETLQSERTTSYQDEPQHQYIPQPQEIRPLTAEERFAFQQGRYEEVLPRLFEISGINIQEYQQMKAELLDMKAGKFTENAVESFLEDEKNLDYYPSEYNLQQMEGYMNAHYPGQVWSKRGLDAAYTYLSANGLLEKYPEQANQPLSMSTGLSDRMATSEQPIESTADDLDSLSTADMRQRLIDRYRRQ